MADVFSKEKRSWVMSRIKSESGLEKKLASLLRKNKIRFERHSKVIGRPDFKIKGKNIVIFIDGCFWHKCPIHFIEPKSKKKFWIDKIERNVKRGREVNKRLKERGYRVLRFWEHDVENKSEHVIKKLAKAISEPV
jgi:DNA mismatch endonuclease (patch repair protein)